MSVEVADRFDVLALMERIRQIKAMDFRKYGKDKIAEVAIELEQLEMYIEEYGKLLFFRPNPAQEIFLNPPGRESIPRVRLLIGGNRCLGGETVVDAAGERTVEELFYSGEAFQVLSWSEERRRVVKTWALPPFRMAEDQLYKVTLGSGESFVASGEHRVLVYEPSLHLSTYQPVSELLRGSLLFRPQSSLEYAPSIRLPSGRSLLSRVPSFPESCSVYYRLCGVQPHTGIDSALGDSPSQGDVLRHTSCFLGWDGLVSTQGRNRLRQYSDLLSILDALGQIADHGDDRQSRASCTSLRCAYGSHRECSQSGSEFCPHRSMFLDAQYPNSETQYDPSTTSFVNEVISIHPIRKDFKYDFHVPIFNNYYAGGAFHHNCGKTEVLVYDAISMAHGERFWSGQKIPIKLPNRGRICVTSYLDGGKKVLEPKLKRLIPNSLLRGGSWSSATKQGQQGCVVEVHFENGSWFDVVSSEQESMKHEGADMDWFGADEPLPREHWIANWRGLTDRQGYAMFALTPLTEPWLKEELWDKQFTEPELYFGHRASTYDNVGFGLTEAGVKAYESQLSEDEKQTRIEGNFLILQGMVYKEYRDQMFDPEQAMAGNVSGHLIEPFQIPEDWPRFVGIDPHDRTPTHILWTAVDPHDDLYVYDELAIGGKSVAEIAEEIKKREALHDEPGFRVIRLIDPASKQEKGSVEVGMSIYEMFMRAGIYCYLPNHDLTPGHKAVREYLRFQKTLRGLRPRVFIFNTLRGLRRSIMNYVYDDRSLSKGSNKDYREPKDNKVREKDKHYPDTFRYVCIFEPKYWHRREEKRQGIRDGREFDK